MTPKRSNRASVVVIVAGSAVLMSAAVALADDRKFTYVDEARVAPLHNFEFEQWVTWAHTNDDDGDVNKYSFKEEFEYGIFENAQLGVELPAWHFTTGPDDEKDGPRLDAIAADLKYVFFDPAENTVGFGAKVEAGWSEEQIELEGDAIVQFNLEKWEFAYDLRLEAGWGTGEDGDRYSEEEGELSERLGVSYEALTKFFVGAELLHEIPLPDWHTGSEPQVLWIGPNASYHATNWAATLTILPRINDVDEEPNLQVRAIFEVDF